MADSKTVLYVGASINKKPLGKDLELPNIPTKRERDVDMKRAYIARELAEELQIDYNHANGLLKGLCAIGAVIEAGKRVTKARGKNPMAYAVEDEKSFGAAWDRLVSVLLQDGNDD